MAAVVNERPILFSAPMVLAILAGTKTQTRRILKPAPPSIESVLSKSGSDFSIFTDQSTPGAYRVSGPVWAVRELMGREPDWKCPYGAPRDHLWVRETWLPDPPIDDTWASTEWNGCGRRAAEVPGQFQKPEFCLYAASFDHAEQQRWVPSIHMYRWASRIALEIASVRVERLQDISEEDAKAEGVTTDPQDGKMNGKPARLYPMTHRQAFIWLWDAINGKRPGCAWRDNPWVWAVEFKRVLPDPHRPPGPGHERRRVGLGDD